jgi:hypothetical protein
MFACPGLIFYTVCSVPSLNGNLALAEKCSGPLRFRLRQVLLCVCVCVGIYIYDISSLMVIDLTLILLTWRKW